MKAPKESSGVPQSAVENDGGQVGQSGAEGDRLGCRRECVLPEKVRNKVQKEMHATWPCKGRVETKEESDDEELEGVRCVAEWNQGSGWVKKA